MRRKLAKWAIAAPLAWALGIGSVYADTVVQGSVVDQDSNVGIADATVSVLHRNSDGSFSLLTTTQTDASGNFSVDVSSADAQLYFSAEHSGYFSSDLVEYADQQVTLELNVQNLLVINARDVSGFGIYGVRFTVSDATDPPYAFEAGTTSNAGVLAFALPNGTYAICQRNPYDIYLDSCYDNQPIAADGTITFTPLTLHGGGTTSIDFPMNTGATLSGTLTDRDTGQPIAYSPAAIHLFTPSGQNVVNAAVQTGLYGSFSIGGVLPGQYIVGAGADWGETFTNTYTTHLYGGNDCGSSLYWNPPLEPAQPCDFTGATVVDVTPSGVTGLAFDLFPGDIVSGTVYDRDTGNPIPYAHIYSCSQIVKFAAYQGAQTTADASGHYRLAHADIASMTFTASAGGYATEWLPGGFDAATASSGACVFYPSILQSVADHLYNGIDFYLPAVSTQGRIAGQSVFEQRQISYGYNYSVPATVVIFDANSGERVATIHTDPNGAYVSPPLPAGEYVVTGYDDDGTACTSEFGINACNLDMTFPGSLGVNNVIVHDGEIKYGYDLYWDSLEIFMGNFER